MTGTGPEPTVELDDLTTRFGHLRARLTGSDGRTYRQVRQELRPRWIVVWADLAATWAVLAGVVAVLVAAQDWPRATWIPLGLLGALLIGVLVHRIGLFVHEGSHGNVAPGRFNDPVTNLAAGLVTMTEVGAYRPIHMQHHRAVGTTADTENTYFLRLDPRFLVRALTGVHVVDVIRNRSEVVMDTPSPSTSPFSAVLVIGAGLHAALVIGSAVAGWWLLAVAWTVGVVSAYPAVQSVRQLLEHRSDTADGSVDYRRIDMGPMTRMFDHAALGLVLGGAGFNRHLLHHWDAGVSYTRLKELQTWLAGTDAGPLVSGRETTYAGSFRRLWRV
jgi:fatty acid desaturase